MFKWLKRKFKMSHTLKDFADGSAHTTDATQTTAITWTPQDNAAFEVTMTVIARQSNGNGRAVFKQTALLSRDSGTVTVVAAGTQEKVANAGAASWVVSAAVTNNAITVSVTGVAAQTIDWNCFLEGTQVGPF
jgi:hypothetical protein